MAVFKCKMCGGNLNVVAGSAIASCPYCGSQMTVSTIDDVKTQNLYERANALRMDAEFDKAAALYELLVQANLQDAEAYWSLVLCEYGVEYVKDPQTGQYVPTCHRTQASSILSDENYKAALQYADAQAKNVYIKEAETINQIQKDILEISQKEKPFDVFICYKETDARGGRTPDSVLAHDVYEELREDGFRVFFARVTLEDKLGTEYEPYIFAALHSAKVMLVVATSKENAESVWVKNEWSRYLALIKDNENEKTLVPVYKDIDPYDLPEEFASLQAQDMNKLGAMQDLVRGVRKLVRGEDKKQTSVNESNETVAPTIITTNIDGLLERAFLFLEDGEFARADECLEQVLNNAPRTAKAYVGKLMVEIKAKKAEEISALAKRPLEEYDNFEKALRFSDEKTTLKLNEEAEKVKERLKDALLEREYNTLRMQSDTCNTPEEYRHLAQKFDKMGDYKDSSTSAVHYRAIADKLENENLNAAREEAEKLRVNAERQKIERQRAVSIGKEVSKNTKHEVVKKQRCTKKGILAIGALFLVVIIVFVIIKNPVSENNLNNASDLAENIVQGPAYLTEEDFAFYTGKKLKTKKGRTVIGADGYIENYLRCFDGEKTYRGISLGSTQEQVLLAYQGVSYKDEDTSDIGYLGKKRNKYIFDGEYGQIVFEFYENVVGNIYIKSTIFEPLEKDLKEKFEGVIEANISLDEKDGFVAELNVKSDIYLPRDFGTESCNLIKTVAKYIEKYDITISRYFVNLKNNNDNYMRRTTWPAMDNDKEIYLLYFYNDGEYLNYSETRSYADARITTKHGPKPTISQAEDAASKEIETFISLLLETQQKYSLKYAFSSENPVQYTSYSYTIKVAMTGNEGGINTNIIFKRDEDNNGRPYKSFDFRFYQGNKEGITDFVSAMMMCYTEEDDILIAKNTSEIFFNDFFSGVGDEVLVVGDYYLLITSTTDEQYLLQARHVDEIWSKYHNNDYDYKPLTYTKYLTFTTDVKSAHYTLEGEVLTWTLHTSGTSLSRLLGVATIRDKDGYIYTIYYNYAENPIKIEVGKTYLFYGERGALNNNPALYLLYF